MVDTIRLDQLPTTVNPDLAHALAAMKDGVTVQLTVTQILSLLGSITGSGLASGGGDLSTGNKQIDVPIASQAEAEAGTNNEKAMTSLRTAQAIAALAVGLPTGACISFPATTPPTGFIKRNGATLSRTAYADLWAYAQASGNLAASEGAKDTGQFGPGDGSTTFSIPDGRGEFERGWDDGRGVDSGRGIGTSQLDAMQQITGTFGSIVHGTNTGPHSSGATSRTGITSAGDGGVNSRNISDLSFDSANSPGARTATETRPRNVALLACIKY